MFALLVASFAFLFVSLDPVVGMPARPTSRDIAAVRGLWQQLQVAQGADGGSLVHLNSEAIGAIAALASDATGHARFNAGIERGVLSGKASVALPAGLWINLSGTVEGTHVGFPAYRLQVGRVPFPPVASRWAADFARQVLLLKGVTLPPLDDMIRHVEIGQQQVTADLLMPKGSGATGGVIGGLVSAGAAPLDERLVSEIYCRIAAGQREVPVANLSELIGRAFNRAPARRGVEFNRATFVALSLLIVGDKGEALAPRAVALARNCPRPAGEVRLQHREDLAKHWAFSAGLTAVLGEETAANLGEWKELDDSLPNGSGFSFVDLAADRSGAQTALRALDPGSAAQIAAELGRATDEDLLPRALLEAPEGLPEASFVDRFGSLDRERYRLAVTSIDRVLAQQRSLRANGTDGLARGR